MHWCTPEIIVEYVRDRCMRTQIAILFYGADIIEHEIALTAIIVANYTSNDHYRSKNTSRIRSRHAGKMKVFF